MCLGISGSPMLSLKSKAEALKYAIEFTSTGEYPNRQYNMKKAKELFDFICENVQLPDVETDQLSNSLNGFISLMEKLNKKDEETKDKVNEESEPTGEVIGEQTKEEVISLPGFCPLSTVANNLRSILRDNKFKPIDAEGANDCSKELFRLDGYGEFLKVILIHSIAPLPEKE